MKLPVVLAVIVLAAAPPAAARAHAQAPAVRAVSLDSVRALLPAGTITMDVMDLAPSPRLAELGERLVAGARANPEWFQKAVRTAAPGEPIAYDPRMGLTEAEWQEYQRLSRGQTLAKVAEGPLAVRVEGTRLVLDGGAGFPDLTGLAIDLAADELVTAAGTVRGSEEDHNDGGGAIGPFDGRTWRKEEGTPESGDIKTVRLTVGRLRESGRGLLHWEWRAVEGGRLTRRVVRVLYFDPPR